MAEIPGLPDITGIDPLNPMGLPVVPQAAPMGIQSPIPPVVPELAGVQGLDMYQPSPEPLPWPPPDFFAGGQPPIPKDPTAPSPGEVIPESAPATQQAGPAGLAALEQARADGAPPPPVQYKNAPPPRQSTGDPYLDMLNETSGQKAEALQAKSEAEKQRNEYVAAEGTRIAQEAQAKQTAADNEYRQVYNEAKAKRAELDAEAKAIAEQKIDPDRAMNAMSVEKKIAIAIGAIVVSQSSNSLRTGKNSVMDAVNDIVTRDMAAQEADLKNRKDVLLTRRGLASDDQAAGRDMLDVQYRSINAAYGMAENAMKSAQLRYNNPVLDADLAYQYAELEERRTTLGQNYIQAKQEQIYQRKQDANRNALGWYNAQTGRMGVENEAAARAGKNGPTVGEAVQLSKEQRDQQTWHDDRYLPGVKTMDGGEVLTLSQPEGEKYRKKLGATTGFVQRIDQLVAIRAKNKDSATGAWRPFKSWGDEDIKAAKAIYEDLLNDYSLAKEQGVIRKEDYVRYDAMFGDVAGLMDNTTNLNTARNGAIQNMNNELQQQARPGQGVAWWDPAGVASGNGSVDATSTNPTSFDAEEKKRRGVEASRFNRDNQNQPAWEEIEQSPDGSKVRLANGLVIPRGRRVVDQKSELDGRGDSHTVYILDDGSRIVKKE